MEKTVKLNEAFRDFTQASKSLETFYTKLTEQVRYLTQELEKKNAQLNRAILEVRESKDYLHTVLQSIGEAIVVLDQDKKISMINKAAEELLCIGSADARGMIFEELAPGIKDGSAGTRLTVNGSAYDIILSRSNVTGQDGSVRGCVILIKDISRIKELERHHERNERLIAMGEMAAKIVHEIRSPLCSIELFSNMLSDDLKGTSHSDMADGISTGIKSLNNILTNMLFFAKPQKPSFTEIKLQDIIKESVGMLLPLIQVRRIKLSKKLSHDTVYGDSELLKQVIMNVVLNAVQSMPDGGNLKIAMWKMDEFVGVDVSDEGEGISPENIEKIFDPFFSTKDKGTGLGLAIAHKIMQGHRGFIKAHRNEGRGSTFRLMFPLETDKNYGEVQNIFCEKAGK